MVFECGKYVLNLTFSLGDGHALFPGIWCQIGEFPGRQNGLKKCRFILVCQ